MKSWDKVRYGGWKIGFMVLGNGLECLSLRSLSQSPKGGKECNIKVIELMKKIMTYIVGTVLINGIVIGAPYWRMLGNLGSWFSERLESVEIFGFYDELSLLQVTVIGILELGLLLFLVGRSTGEQEIAELKM